MLSAQKILKQSEPMVQLVLKQQNSDGIEIAYARFLESDAHSRLVKERVTKEVEEKGGIHKLIENSITQARKILQDEAHQQSQVSQSSAFRDVNWPSRDSLFEGGIGAIGIGLAAIGLALTAPISLPVAAGLSFAGGVMVGFGGASVDAAFEP